MPSIVLNYIIRLIIKPIGKFVKAKALFHKIKFNNFNSKNQQQKEQRHFCIFALLLISKYTTTSNRFLQKPTADKRIYTKLQQAKE